jgi:hypothetical protein
MATCDCTIPYEVVAVHFKQLLASGAEDPASVKYLSDNIVDWDYKPEIEEGKKNILRCGGRVKNTMQDTDSLTGGTLKLTFCCEDPEIEHIVAGGVGTVTYDASSPPCATGYDEPTPAQQAAATDYIVWLYLKVVNGSSVTGYKELTFWDCKPAFFAEGGGQEEHPTISVDIKCVDNPNYVPAKGVKTWKRIAAIPTV